MNNMVEYSISANPTLFPQPKVKKILFQSVEIGKMVLLKMFQTLLHKLFLSLEREK